MTKDDERSLQKRPELIPEQLMQGGFIVGVENFHGSLMNVTGMAIERITRERSEVPPQFKLPERPVYFLDPNSRRMIMISNRERPNAPPWQQRLFAEIVELDDKGQPQFRLSTQEVVLLNNQYQLVAVGPNTFKMPPSYIEMVEDDDPKNPKFVPWNVYLGSLQGWMNAVNIEPDEDFNSFAERFSRFRKQAKEQAEKKIEETFPDGKQGIDAENTMPVNMIVTDRGKDSFLYQVSLQSGLYPLLVNPLDLAKVLGLSSDLGNFTRNRDLQSLLFNPSYNKLKDIFSAMGGKLQMRHFAAIVTLDDQSIQGLYVKTVQNQDFTMAGAIANIRTFIHSLQKDSPLFAVALVKSSPISRDSNRERISEKLEQNPDYLDIRKISHGLYSTPSDEDFYRGLLYKLKADLLLTMFIRGGAPIVK